MNPNQSRRTAKVMNDPQEYLEWSDVIDLLSHIKAHNKRNYLIFKTLATCGRRVSEVVSDPTGIRPKDIQKPDTIFFHILKKDYPPDYRIPKPAPQELVSELVSFTKTQPQNEIIFDLTRNRIHQLIKKYSKQANITMVNGDFPHPHTLRHSFAIHMAKDVISSPMDLYLLQSILAHADINQTLYYIKMFGQKEAKALVKDLGHVESKPKFSSL